MKFKFILLLGVCALFLNACAQDKSSEDSWKNDVLLANECGSDGLPCCVHSDSFCRYNQQCCYDPSGGGANYCADNCDFGKINQFCRKDEPKCDDEMACYGNFCKLAGGEGEPCRAQGTPCNDALVCYNGLCSTCGNSDQPCCQGDIRCFAGKKEAGLRMDCQEGLCKVCGTQGNPACFSAPVCDKGNLLNNGFCFPCGGLHQPCCEKNEKSDSCGDIGGELRCNLGFCEKITE
jgi:hypothetical protein